MFEIKHTRRHSIFCLLPTATADFLPIFTFLNGRSQSRRSRSVVVRRSAGARDGDAFLFVRSVGDGDFDVAKTAVFFLVGRDIAD